MPRPRLMRRETIFFAFVLLHAPFGLLLRRVGEAGVVYPLLVVAYGLYQAARGRPGRVFDTAAYAAGAEVLWRMTGSSPLWEFGKYSVILLLLAGAFSLRSQGAEVSLPADRGERLGYVYALLLMPSALLTVQALGLAGAQGALSFNLSGPLCLALSVIVLSRLSVWGSPRDLDLERLVVALLAPIAAVAGIAFWATRTAGRIAFSSESNFVTSGGFGPNQVSGILGLGAFLALVLALQNAVPRFRWMWAGVSALLITQAILTFSRGGVLAAGIAAGAFLAQSLRQPRLRATAVVALALLALLGTQVIVPWLNEWTDGALERRYSDLGTTGRSQLAGAELDLWRENPLLGVGPGLAQSARTSSLHLESATHTEYSRLLAEHGLLGALALLTLVVIAWNAYRRAPSPLARAWVCAFAFWSLAEMGHSAMRMASISFAFGLATLGWWLPGDRSVARSGRASGRAGP